MASKYRIIKHEYFGYDGKLVVNFEPQHRFLGLFWCGYSNHDCDSCLNLNFPTLEEAEDFLRQVERMGGSTDSSTIVAEYR